MRLLPHYVNMRVELVAMHGRFSKCDVERAFGVVWPNKVSNDALKMGKRPSIWGLGFDTIKGFREKLLPRGLLSLRWREG